MAEDDLLAAVKAERLRRRQEELRSFTSSYSEFRSRVKPISEEWGTL